MPATTLREKLAWRAREYSARLRDWLARNGLRPGNREYQPFVLLCGIRTGSTMLASYLRSHSSVLMLSEVFKYRPSAVSFGTNGFRGRAHDEDIVELRNTDPVRFLKEEVFRVYPAHLDAVGFKLTYTQARGRKMWWDAARYADWWEHMDDDHRRVWRGANSDLWNSLRSQTDIKIIQLVRENLLRQELSVRMAKRTEEWKSTQDSTGSTERPRVRIDPKICKRDFEARERMRREAQEEFEDHDVLQVSYEQVKEDPAETLNRIQRFLGLNVEALRTQTRKQETRSLEEAIANYAELRDALADTPWYRFFEE